MAARSAGGGWAHRRAVAGGTRWSAVDLDTVEVLPAISMRTSGGAARPRTTMSTS